MAKADEPCICDPTVAAVIANDRSTASVEAAVPGCLPQILRRDVSNVSRSTWRRRRSRCFAARARLYFTDLHAVAISVLIPDWFSAWAATPRNEASGSHTI